LRSPGFIDFEAKPDGTYKYENSETCNTLQELISKFLQIEQRMRVNKALYISVQGDGSTDLGITKTC